MSVADRPLGRPLRRWERVGLWLLLLVMVVFACLVVNRAALLSRRMGDAGVFFRAAWAVRAGADLYAVRDDNGWHYLYPPMTAILLAPLADPPADVPRDGYLPYVVSVSLWTLMTFAALWLSADLLARAARGPPGSAGSDRRTRVWWALRILPLLAVLPDAAHSLSRGQIDTLMLLALAFGAYFLTRGWQVLAGVALAVPACIKLFPGLVGLAPLADRRWRVVLGGILGGVLGFVVLPLVALGPSRAWEMNQRWAQVLLMPGLGLGEDTTRERELLSLNGNENNSIRGVLHSVTFIHLKRWQRPGEPELWMTVVHAGMSLALIGLVVWCAMPRRAAGSFAETQVGGGWLAPSSARRSVLFLGSLTGVMIIASPVCHSHYFVLALPLWTGLVAHHLRQRPDGVSPLWLYGLVGGVVLVRVLLRVPGTEVPLREAGAFLWSHLIVLGFGLAALWRASREVARAASPAPGALPQGR